MTYTEWTEAYETNGNRFCADEITFDEWAAERKRLMAINVTDWPEPETPVVPAT